MKEYIEREALLDEINRMGGHGLCEWDTLGVKALVARQPIVVVGEIIYCSECKFIDTENCPMSGTKGSVSVSDFCSHGERKE